MSFTEPYAFWYVARIAAGEGRFNQNSDVDINTEVKSIAVTKKGVYFAFRDQGACISVLAVKVYYITCPAITENFAHFNETPTGREITIIEKQTGICVKNAESSEPPTYLCKGDGKWTILTSGCKCKVGFEPDYEKQTCTGKWYWNIRTGIDQKHMNINHKWIRDIFFSYFQFVRLAHSVRVK